ncbi:chemotaxis protein MotC [Mesorhizobium sp. KR2-14]|uniref:chemotaxis protein MotC n=1 Tax=Mesorhizobium sp. KR2-14 TaxID=3156610 RepID=UPI0032B58E09
MRLAARLGGLVGFALLAATLPGRAEDGTSRLQPFQMVRSLQIVQDRIAAGEHAIMPMQRKLLEIIDRRLNSGSKEDFSDPRNLRALLVYAMSGGNPATIRTVLSRLELDTSTGDIGKGVSSYLNGEVLEARAALAPVDPIALPPDLGAFVALVKGSVIAVDEPQEALTLFDQARLLAPGTLIEEGALRRSVDLTATLGDAHRFTLSSIQYVERYLRSPYASQFADSFVSGVIALHGSLDTATVEAITSMMEAEQERVIYLRIARRAGIDGLKELSAFASAKVEQEGKVVGKSDDPRALLYSSLASISAGTSEEINAKLSRIDRSKLSQSDRELYDAVASVATKLTARPPTLNEEAPADQPGAEAQADDADELIIIEAEKTTGEQPQTAQPESVQPQEPVQQADNAVPSEPTDEVVASTRKKLDEIDRMLGGVQ